MRKRLNYPIVTHYAARLPVTGRAIMNALWYVEGIPIDESATGASWMFDAHGAPTDDESEAVIAVDATFVAEET